MRNVQHLAQASPREDSEVHSLQGSRAAQSLPRSLTQVRSGSSQSSGVCSPAARRRCDRVLGGDRNAGTAEALRSASLTLSRRSSSSELTNEVVQPLDKKDRAITLHQRPPESAAIQTAKGPSLGAGEAGAVELPWRRQSPLGEGPGKLGNRQVVPSRTKMSSRPAGQRGKLGPTALPTWGWALGKLVTGEPFRLPCPRKCLSSLPLGLPSPSPLPHGSLLRRLHEHVRRGRSISSVDRSKAQPDDYK